MREGLNFKVLWDVDVNPFDITAFVRFVPVFIIITSQADRRLLINTVL